MKSISIVVFLMVALFGLSSAQDGETKLNLLNMFTSSIFGKVFDSRRLVGEEDEKAVFSFPFFNRPANAPSKLKQLGIQGESKIQFFKKVQVTNKPFAKFPRISSAIEKFTQPIKSQLSPVEPQIAPQIAPQIPQQIAPQYQEYHQYYNHFQTAPALPYF